MPYQQLLASGGTTYAILQGALNTVAAGGGGIVEVVDGTWPITQPLKIKDNVHLRMGNGVVLVRDFTGGGVVTPPSATTIRRTAIRTSASRAA